MNKPTEIHSYSEMLQFVGMDSVFIFGAFGSGKTQAGLDWFDQLIQKGTPADEVLILVPQRSIGMPYFIKSQESPACLSGFPTLITINGLARRMIQMFWPLVCESTYFANPKSQPTFLSIETAQYCMRKVLTPYLEAGYFNNIHLEPNRLFSQILDNLNKSAFIDLPIEKVFKRLSDAWCGEPSRLLTYRQAEEAAKAFREFCITNTFLDTSLQIDIFHKYLWKNEICRKFLENQYHHIIYDNVEEDVPVSHDILLEWLPSFNSALLLYDMEAGYRSFLGADSQSALRLKDVCSIELNSEKLGIDPKPMDQLKELLSTCILKQPLNHSIDPCNQNIEVHENRFVLEMVESVANKVHQLLEQGTPAHEIAILGAYISDAFLFSIKQALQKYNIDAISTRPSRSLINEPAVRSILTIAKLVFPNKENWIIPSQEIRHALQVFISDLDVIRADLISKMLFNLKESGQGFHPFSSISKPQMRERITFTTGERVDFLQSWIENFRNSEEQTLDIFISRLFGEVLTQPGFNFAHNMNLAKVVSRLIQVTKSFRFEFENQKNITPFNPIEVIEAVESGIFGGIQTENDFNQEINAVLISPAFSFLLQNRAVSYQFWLDVGSLGWWERLNQPLTQPYILSRNWKIQNRWSDDVEFENNQNNMNRLIRGLLVRCSQKVFVETIRYNEQGYEPRGPLLRAFQQWMKLVNDNSERHHV